MPSVQAWGWAQLRPVPGLLTPRPIEDATVRHQGPQRDTLCTMYRITSCKYTIHHLSYTSKVMLQNFFSMPGLFKGTICSTTHAGVRPIHVCGRASDMRDSIRRNVANQTAGRARKTPISTTLKPPNYSGHRSLMGAAFERHYSWRRAYLVQYHWPHPPLGSDKPHVGVTPVA